MRSSDFTLIQFFWHHIWVQQIWVLFSLWKGNCETFQWKTSHFMSNDCLKLQETLFSKAILTIFYMKMVSTRQVRHLWVASNITISLRIIMCQSDAQVWPLLSHITTGKAALGCSNGIVGSLQDLILWEIWQGYDQQSQVDQVLEGLLWPKKKLMLRLLELTYLSV